LIVDDLIPTRYSLLSRLQNWEDQESWRDFFDTYWHLIYSVAVKSGLTEEEAQDVVQETVLCVAKEIQNFQRNRELGSFKAWLRNLTHWRIADQIKKREFAGLEPDSAAGEELRRRVENVVDESVLHSEALWEEEWRKNLFAAAVTRVKRSVKPEHYQIFDLYAVKGLPVKKVARVLGVSPAAVYVAKHRVASLIKLEIQALEKEQR
jgi:RNA polymerase sigma factor (sigma-70 family)